MKMPDIMMLIVAGVFIGAYQTGLLPSTSVIDYLPLILMAIGYSYLRYRIHQQDMTEIELEEIKFSRLVRERLRALWVLQWYNASVANIITLMQTLSVMYASNTYQLINAFNAITSKLIILFHWQLDTEYEIVLLCLVFRLFYIRCLLAHW